MKRTKEDEETILDAHAFVLETAARIEKYLLARVKRMPKEMRFSLTARIFIRCFQAFYGVVPAYLSGEPTTRIRLDGAEEEK